MELTLPTPPSTNNLFRNVAKGRTKTERYLTWLRAAGNELRAQKPKRIGGPISVTIIVGEDKRRDLDNYSKAILDLLVACNAIDDDRNVSSLHLARADRDKRSVIVTVEAV